MLVFQIDPESIEGALMGVREVSLSWMLRESLAGIHPPLRRIIEQSREFDTSIRPRNIPERTVAAWCGLDPEAPVPLPTALRVSIASRHRRFTRPSLFMLRSDLLPPGMTAGSLAESLGQALGFAALADEPVRIRPLRQAVRPSRSAWRYIATDVQAPERCRKPLAYFDRHIRESIYLSMTADPEVARAAADLPSLDALGFCVLSAEPATDNHHDPGWTVTFEVDAMLDAPICLGLDATAYDTTRGFTFPAHCGQHA